jgi:hypothetical protein
MKKKILLCLAVLFLVTACSSASTPTPEATPLPYPTPSIKYQVVGKTMSTYMVVVDPKSSTDREGLQELSDYLCVDRWVCLIWYWDDVNKADTSYPVDPANEQTLIAKYSFDAVKNERGLVVYALGDK